MNVKTEMEIRLMKGLCSGSVEGDNQRAARVEHLEEFVGRGDYQVSALDIVDAMLANIAPDQQPWEDFSGLPELCRPLERKGLRLVRSASHF